MLSKDDYKNTIANCIARFVKLYPDCGYDINTFMIHIVEPEQFIDVILKTQDDCDYKVSREECVRNHNGDDAILIRGNSSRTIIIVYMPEKPLAMLGITVYHELAHEYAMRRETESGYDFSKRSEGDKSSTKNMPDVVSGYLLWKEFVADYIAYDTLHHDMERIPVIGKTGVDTMSELIPRMCAGVIQPTLAAFSSMANACAIIMNFDGFHNALYGGKLKMPINCRTRAGRELYNMFIDLLFMLNNKLESENPYALTDDFLNKLGYAAIEVELLHGDYDDEIGW